MCFPSQIVVFAILLLALSSFIFNAAAGEEDQEMDQTVAPMSSSVPDMNMNATEGASMSTQMDGSTVPQGGDQSDGTTPSMDSSSMSETDSEMPMPTTPPSTSTSEHVDGETESPAQNLDTSDSPMSSSMPDVNTNASMSTQMDGSTEQPGEQGEDQSSVETTPSMDSGNMTAETDSEFSTIVSTSSDGENEESTDETTVGSSLQCYTFSESDTLRKIDCRPIDTHCLTFRCNGTTIKDCAFPEDGPEEACKDSIKNCESENGVPNVDPHYCQYCTGNLCNNDEPNGGSTANPTEEATDGTTPNPSEEASDGTTPNQPEEATDETTPNQPEDA